MAEDDDLAEAGHKARLGAVDIVGEDLQVVTNACIQGQLVCELEVILHEETQLVGDVAVGQCTGV